MRSTAEETTAWLLCWGGRCQALQTFSRRSEFADVARRVHASLFGSSSVAFGCCQGSASRRLRGWAGVGILCFLLITFQIITIWNGTEG